MRKQITRRELLRATRAAAVSSALVSVAGRAPRAQMPRHANLLLVFPDQHRYDWTSLDGAIPVRTPNLARLAEEGARFERAFCPAPVCAASRACLALGREYGRTGVAGNEHDLAEDARTFYAMLRDAGYRVGSTGKLDLRKKSHDWGPDGMHRVNGREFYREWGFTDGFDSEGKGDSFRGIRHRDGTGEPYGESPYTKMLTDRNDGSLQRYIQWRDDREKSGLPINGFSYTKPIELADEAYNDNWVGQNALDLIEDFPKDKPWFLQVNFPGPHNPMDITPTMAPWYKDTKFDQPFKNTQLPPDVHLEIRRNYSAMVDNIDRWLGRYLDAIDRRGELDTTLVVFSSDHGEMLGDHNRWGKTVPYQPSAGVPMVVRGPGVKKGIVHKGPTETLDLTATFLDYAGVPVPDSMDSRSLRPLLEGHADAARKHAVSGLKEWRLVCDGRYKLVRGFNASKPDKRASGEYQDPESGTAESNSTLQLFDLEADPVESTNIAEKHPEIVKLLEPLLPRT
ncbi:MAG: arylsulfatase [Candidatus Hydrogenedentota bacterium]